MNSQKLVCRRCSAEIQPKAARKLCQTCFEDLIGYDDCAHCGSPVIWESTVTEEVIRCTLCAAMMKHKGSKEALRIMWNARMGKNMNAEVTEGHPDGCYCFVCVAKRHEKTQMVCVRCGKEINGDWHMDNDGGPYCGNCA